MSYTYVEYAPKAGQLAAAGQELLDRLGKDTDDIRRATDRIEQAASVTPAGGALRGFAPSREVEKPAEPSDVLSALLLDLQAANILMASGVALKQSGDAGDPSFLKDAVRDVRTSKLEVTAELSQGAIRRFAPGEKSATLEKAIETYRKEATAALQKVVDDSGGVMSSVFENLKELDGGDVTKAIESLGKSFQIVDTATRLIKTGWDKLKSALKAIVDFLGESVFGQVKDKVAELWKDFGGDKIGGNLLRQIFDVAGAERNINAALEQKNLNIENLDAASTSIDGLVKNLGRHMGLLNSVVKGIALAGTIVAFLHVAIPGGPFAIIGLYLVVVAAAVVLGMDYCDSGRAFDWVAGVGRISKQILPG